MDKNDTAITHDIDIKDGGGQVIVDQDTIPGGQETQYSYDALEPGTYTFFCSIHPIPQMTGTLTVQ